MEYSAAKAGDIDAILALHKSYHVDTVLDEDRSDGFVTTPFSPELLIELIERENGLFMARDSDRIAGYAMSASWQFCSQWPMFAYMISRLSELPYRGRILNTENSYQYGPVCIDKPYRGKGVFQDLFAYALHEMSERYPYMVTFVNKTNPRSVAAHVDKLKMDLLKEFEYNGNNYLELVCPTATGT